MKLTDYVTLGRSGLRVSPYCLGTMTFGTDWGWGAEEAEAIQVLERYMELGGNFLDTANCYTNGHSEVILGNYFGKNPFKRDRMVIATKGFGNMYSGDPNGGGTNFKSLINACDESLRRLQTDYIDLYYVHHWDPHTPVEETMYALNYLVQCGKVRYIAFSDTPAWVTCKAQMIARQNHWAPLTAYEMEYNLGERTVESEMIPMAKELGIGVVTWSPLKKGLFSGKYTRENNGNVPGGRLSTRYKGQVITEQQFQIIDELIAIAKQCGTTPSAVAIAWVKGQPAGSIPLLGARTITQLEANLKVLDFELPPEAAAKLTAMSMPPATFIEHDILSENAISMLQTGTTINGWTSKPWPMTPGPDDIRW